MPPTASKASVSYRPAVPFAAQRCATCTMFRPNRSTVRLDFAAMFGRGQGACTLVKGAIRGRDVCDQWAGSRA